MNATPRARPSMELLLTPPETAAALGITIAELKATQAAGHAPAHIQLGPRTVRYFRAAVIEAVSTR
jgi:predicted DNA-binding transcriptional regulator AlpA